MLVAFWSTGNGKSGTTSNLIGTAVAAAQYQGKSVLLLEGTFGSHTIEESFEHYNGYLIRESSVYFHGGGIDYLIHSSKYHLLDTKAAEEGIRVVQKELAYVPGSVGMNRELYEKGFNKHCESILSCLNSIVDYVFIDCGPGYSTMNQRILNMADTVAVNLSLNEKVMDEFFQIRTFFHEKIVYLIGNYNLESNYSVSKIQNIYRIRDDYLGIVPANKGFCEAMARGDVLRFFKIPRSGQRAASYMEFMERICKASDMILRKTAEFAVK